MNAWNNIYRTVSKQAEQFFSQLETPLRRQQQVLKDILQQNKKTQYGQLYNFDKINDINDFQTQVPICTYDNLSAYIQSISEGEDNVLTTEAVTVFEATGGSTQGAKLIPYTNTLLLSFQKALHPWLYDLLNHRKKIAEGSAYWSISPAMRKPATTSAGIPIGLTNDAAYFGNTLAADILMTLAVPAEIGSISDFSQWQYFTLRYLLSARDLSLISVWSPGFLLTLMHALIEQYPSLIEDIENHQLRYALPDGLNVKTSRSFEPDKQRIADIKAAFTGEHINTQILWPELDTISCWLDSGSARYRQQLQLLFPQVYLQAKGLLATEGVITLPVCAAESCVLAINSGFYEFIDDQQNVFLLDALNEGQTYQVLMTTYGGLYRYNIGDRVKVTGYLNKTPLLSFVGRSGLISDLSGEKLSEAFVLSQLPDITGTVMLLPYNKPQSGYALFVEQQHYTQQQADQLAAELDLLLTTNPQYAYARQLQQLAPLKAYLKHDIMRDYIQYQSNKGQSLGDIKPVVLSNDSALFDYFTGQNKPVGPLVL